MFLSVGYCVGIERFRKWRGLVCQSENDEGCSSIMCVSDFVSVCEFLCVYATYDFLFVCV